MAQLLSNLPIGAKVKLGKYQVNTETPWDIIWTVVAKSHVGYPANSVTLLAEKCIDMMAFDAYEPSNTDQNRKDRGNNRYSVSNIDQWLNSSNANWYTSRHSADAPPSAANLASFYSTLAYDTKNGFLYNFSNAERNALLDTTIRVVRHSVDGGGYEDITRKVFLPSTMEIANRMENSIAEGGQWGGFSTNPVLTCTLFPQAHTNIRYSDKPTSSNAYINWWVRTPPTTGYSSSGYYYSSIGSLDPQVVSQASTGVRPTVNILSTRKVSDATDSDGCYTFVWNTAPPKPTTITLPSRILGGKSNTISWSSVTDPDGDAVTYQLECSYDNGGTYSTIYSGSAISYIHIPTYGKTTILYRVKAIDALNESSAYTTSANVTITNNTPPAISGTDGNLGVKSSGFTGTYTVTDVNSNAVTVTESIDGVQIRSLVVTLGATNTYGITGNTWLALSNGSHTLKISATDGIDTTVRTYTFTKLVNTLRIQNATPWAASTMPSRIMLVITRNIPSTATFKVEVCNNGYDSSPTWEDATAPVKSGLVHVFTNTTKTASNWGVRVRVTVDRNGSTGACYVSAIGGNFE